MDQENTPQHNQNRGQITAGSVAKYALLPGILPRLKRLGFVLAKFLHVFTTLFGAAGLIPANHPCLRPENIGRYKFTEIVGLAAHNVKLTREHLPQTIMFFAIIGAYLLTILTAILSMLQMVAGTQAHAQFFSNPQETPASTDFAYNMLHYLFGPTGIDSIWTGADSTGGNAINQVHPMSMVLQSMLGHYSKALLILAAFMIVYQAIVAVISAAQSGKPFGRSFDSIYTPLRLAAAIGLLVPITGAPGSGGGYNGAQLIAFQVADWGSALGSNVWATGIRGVGSGEFFVSMRAQPDYSIPRGIFVSFLCGSLWNENSDKLGVAPNSPDRMGMSTLIDSSSGYKVFRIGNKYDSNYCGEFKIPIKAQTQKISVPVTSSGFLTSGNEEVDLTAISRLVIADYGTAYNNTFREISKLADAYAEQIVSLKPGAQQIDTLNTLPNSFDMHQNIMNAYLDTLDKGADGSGPLNGIYFDSKPYDDVITNLNQILSRSLSAYTKYGWGNAGGFYLRISRMASNISENYKNNPPEISRLPTPLINPGKGPKRIQMSPYMMPMGTQSASAVDGSAETKLIAALINPRLSEAYNWFVDAPQDFCNNISPCPHQAYLDKLKYNTKWRSDNKNAIDNSRDINKKPAAAFDELVDQAYSDVFGFTAKSSINPMGRITNIGVGMLTAGAGLYGAGIFATSSVSILGFGGSMPGLGTALMTIGLLVLMAGFTLAYVVPMMPFFYFSFAVLEWVISVLEAVIGMPLWALSFLMPAETFFGGQTAKGIMSLFEILLRPSIICISLVGSILVFSVGVWFFNLVYNQYMQDNGPTNVVTGTLTSITRLPGLGPDWLISQGIFAFVIYSLSLSSFKLIDAIPNQFMSWIGGSGGFGSQIKTGLSEISGGAKLVGGKVLSDTSSAVGKKVADGAQKQEADTKAQAKAIADRNALANNQNLNPQDPDYSVRAQAFLNLNDRLNP